MKVEEIKGFINRHIGGATIEENRRASPFTLTVAPTKIHTVCEFLHANEKTYFDQLSCLTGLDNGLDAGTMEIIYTLYSIPYDLSLMLRVELERERPIIDSVSDIWKTADWHEREAYDLLGIQFQNHPDLRKILLPDDWEGFPLRKDYEEQEKYHEVKVKY